MLIWFILVRGEKIMKETIKNNIKYVIFLAFCGLVGGYFTGIYTVQTLSPELLNETLTQVGNIEIIYLITALQSLGYAVVLGLLGKILAKKIGLWKKLEFSHDAIKSIILVSVIGGAIFILSDYYVFNNFSSVIKDSYALKPTIEYIIASVIYGGVVEEVMLRLFMMSLIAIIIQKVSKQDRINDRILMMSNVMAALLFAMGHLPATALMIGLTPIIIFRCFLLNGGMGIMFGHVYRKYGIHCAMLAHAGVHIVSKLIWIIFV